MYIFQIDVNGLNLASNAAFDNRKDFIRFVQVQLLYIFVYTFLLIPRAAPKYNLILQLQPNNRRDTAQLLIIN